HQAARGARSDRGRRKPRDPRRCPVELSNSARPRRRRDGNRMSAIETSEVVGSGEIETLERRYSSGAQPKRDVRIVRGAGTRVWDAAGREYLDFTSGLGV